MVRPNDYVSLLEPLPKEFLAWVAKLDSSEFRDYAVSIGRGDKFDNLMSECLPARPDTVYMGATIKSIKGFLGAFRSMPSTNPHPPSPVRDLILATHASQEGFLRYARMDDNSGEGINYEDLQGAVKNRTIEIPPEIFEARPKDGAGKSQGPNFIIKGCLLGRSIPYMELLKKALGAIQVSAPKFVHAAVESYAPLPAGVIEYMLEPFNVIRPTRYASPIHAREGFKKSAKERPEEFKRFGGVVVKPAQWDAWIPQKIHPAQKADETILETEIKERVKAFKRTIDAPGFYVYYKDPWEGHASGKFFITLPKDPGTLEGRKDAVRAHFSSKAPLFSDSHPFPKYKRLGYGSMKELMDGYSWTFVWDGSKSELSWYAVRHVYSLLRPIMDASGNWMINFFPKSGEKGISLLGEADPLFYATV